MISDNIQTLIDRLEKESEFIVVYDEREDGFMAFDTHSDWAWSSENNNIMNYDAVLQTAKDRLIAEEKGEVRWRKHKEFCKQDHTHEDREHYLRNVRLFSRYCDVTVDDEIKRKAEEAYELEINEKKRKEIEIKEQAHAQKKHWINKLRLEGYTIEPPVGETKK